MEIINSKAANTIISNYRLLLYCATMEIKNHEEAEKITHKVLEDQYQINGIVPSTQQRFLLETEPVGQLIIPMQNIVIDMSITWLKALFECKPKVPT